MFDGLPWNAITADCVDKPLRVATRLGISVELLHDAAPRIKHILMNTTFRMFPDSAAAKGKKTARPRCRRKRLRCRR